MNNKKEHSTCEHYDNGRCRMMNIPVRDNGCVCSQYAEKKRSKKVNKK